MPVGVVNFKISKNTDKDLIARTTSELKEQQFNIRSLALSPQTGGNLNITDPINEQNQEYKEILDYNSEVINNFVFQISATDNRHAFNLAINRQPEQPYDNVSLNFNNMPDQQRPIANRLVASLRKKLNAIDSRNFQENALGDQLKTHFQSREEKLNRLEGITTSLIFDQEKYRQELEKQYEQKKKELEEQFVKKDTALKEKEEQLQTKFKQIDDRESRHARRALRETLKSTFQERAKKFTLSDGTVGLRKPIQIFTIILLIVFGTLFVISVASSLKILGLSSENSPETIIRQIFLAIAFASTTVFYFRWSNRWFERHAGEEFILKRQEVDIDRASWVVELASEWLDKGREISPSVTDKLMTNLFTYDKSEPEPLHPFDQFASSLLDSSARVNVKFPNGMGELEVDRKGIKKLQKTTEV